MNGEGMDGGGGTNVRCEIEIERERVGGVGKKGNEGKGGGMLVWRTWK